MKRIFNLLILLILCTFCKIDALEYGEDYYFSKFDINLEFNYIGPSSNQPFINDSMEKYKIDVNYDIDLYSNEDINELPLDLGDIAYYSNEIESNYYYSNGNIHNIHSGNNNITLSTSYITECSKNTCELLLFRNDNSLKYHINIRSNNNITTMTNTVCNNFNSVNETDNNTIVDADCNNINIRIINKDYTDTPIYNEPKGNRFEFNIFNYELTIIVICILSTIVYCYISYREHIKRKSVKEFGIENIYPLEASYIYNEGNKIVGLEAPLYDAARLGYLEFIEKDDKIFIKKLKDYNGEDYTIRISFDYIFRDSDIVDINSIDYKRLYHKLESEIRSRNILETLGVFRMSTNETITAILFAIYVIVSIAIFVPYYKDSDLLITGITFNLISLFVLSTIGIFIYSSENRKYLVKSIVLGIFVLLISILLSVTKLDFITKIAMTILVSCFSIIIIVFKLRKDSNSMIKSAYNNIVEYRNNLVNLNDEKYKKNIKEDKNYSVKILPYAVALDVFSIIFHNILDYEKPKYFKSERLFDEFVYDKHIDIVHRRPKNSLKILLSIIIGILLLIIGFISYSGGYLITGTVCILIGVIIIKNSLDRL